MRRRTIRQLAAFLLALIAVATAPAQEDPRDAGREAAVALNAALAVEQALLEAALESYRAASRQRPASSAACPCSNGKWSSRQARWPHPAATTRIATVMNAPIRRTLSGPT